MKTNRIRLTAVLAWALVAPAPMVAQDLPGAAGPRRAVEDLLAGRFQWTISQPLVAPAQRPEDPCYSVKDPSVVFHQGRWHLFCTIRSVRRSHQIEYLSFADWKEADAAPRHLLQVHDGFYCAPQVFFFAPHRKWYLICQASDKSWKPEYGAAYSITTDIADPASWSRLKPLDARPADGKAGLDFWVICDAQKAHLFFTTLDGRLWREQTRLADFPAGWSEPKLAIQGDLFEASHTYRLKGLDQYLTVVEAQGGHGWRYYKAYLADRLEGPWRPLAATKDHAFASLANAQSAGPRWTDSISHGELLRAGVDQHLEVDPANLRFLFQGVSDQARAGKPYGQIPWRLGMLERYAGPAVPRE
ncbi:MAG: non-reducing end alpha-L-arabinofuranosidase family hydrolase [Thermoguttaceae bacterium]